MANRNENNLRHSVRGSRSGRLILLVGIVAMLTSQTSAVERFWVNTTGGDWYDQQNWSTSLIALPPASVPGIGDVARFEFGGTTYTVTFSNAVDLQSLKIPSDFVTFDLQGRQLDTTQVIHVGTLLNDIGSLTLRNGTVSSPVVFIGFGLGDGRLSIESDAALTVDGSQNGIPITFAVGGQPVTIREGLGLVDIQGTLDILGTDAVVGGVLNGLGIVTVPGGTWTNANSLIIGRDGGEGHVQISDGGIVTVNQQTFVGESGRTNAFVDVTGTGNLSITSGSLTTVGTATIGSAVNSFGDVDMVGANSIWNIGGFLFVAEFGIGNLNIRNGANVQVQNDSFISVGTNEGLLNVTGGGSLINGGNLYVGGSSSAAGGSGHLLVQSDGQVDVGGFLVVWDTGTLTINGGTITTDSLQILPGATQNFASGHLTINGGPFTIPSDFAFGGNNALDPPVITLLNGAKSSVTDFSLGTIPATFAMLDLDNSTINASDDINIGGDDIQALGDALLSSTGGFLKADDLLHIWNDGELNMNAGRVAAGTMRLTGGDLNIAGVDPAVYVDASGDFPIGLPGIHVGFAPAQTDLIIEDGANLIASTVDFSVGADTSSLAMATLTGLGSTMITRGGSIGTLGDGTLNVLDQASATFTGDLTIGQATNSFGGLTIDGTGSSVTCEGNATVGYQGFGQLRMTTGATFHCLGDTMIGALTAQVNPAPGFVILDGGDWVNDQSIYVGGDAIGAQGAGSEIFLKTGGSIVNQGTMQVWSASKLSLEGGDLRTSDLLIESASGLDLLAGSITVDGGQFRYASFGLSFGSADSTNPLDISFVNGANAQTSFPWSIGNKAGTFGTVTVSGVANGSRSTLMNVGLSNFAVGNRGNGKLNVANGALVHISHELSIGDTLNAKGTVDVHGVIDGQRATLLATSTTADVYVGGSLGGFSTGGLGSLDIINGGLVHASGDVYFGLRPTGIGSLRVVGNEGGFDATLKVDGNLYLAGQATVPGGNADLLLGQGGLLDVGGTLRVWPNTMVNVVGGTIRANHLDLTGSNLGSAGLAAGRVEANQITGDLINSAGTFAPGNSPADVILNGNYIQGVSAELEIELAGDDPGTGYDRLQVTGTATLDGTLRVKVVGDYVPSDGHVFTVLTYGARIGQFSEIITDAFLNYEVVYGNNQLQFLVQDFSTVAITGDLNSDGAVNIEDHALFHACMTGPNSTTGLSPGCGVSDIDGDLDADMDDFRIMQLEFGHVATPTVVRWNSVVDGLWSNAVNWLGGLLPGVGQSAIINTPNTDTTVTLDAGVSITNPIENLLCNERLRLDGGTLSVSGTFQMNNTLELASGNIVDTTIDLDPRVSIEVPNGDRPVLDGVTINGNMQMPGTNTIVVKNGLTLNGLITMNGFITSGDAIRLDKPNRMIDGNGRIEFLRPGQNTVIQRNARGGNDLGVLTIGPGITIHGAGGVVGAAGNVFPASVVNDGTIDSDQVGFIVVSGNGSINNGTFRSSFGQAGFLQIVGPWTNNGLVDADGGAFLVRDTWTNNGTLRLGPGPVFDSESDFVQSSFGTFITEIGSTASVGFGQMALTGTATLDGVLRVEFDVAFVPTVGKSFTVLSYGDHIGEFATIETVGLDPAFQIVPTYNANFLVLNIEQP